MSSENRKPNMKTLSETELSAVSGAKLVRGNPEKYECEHERRRHRRHDCDDYDYGREPVIIRI